MAKHHQRRTSLNVGCWNMRTLVESEGSIATSLARPGSRSVSVDRKAMFMVQELRKYGMNLTGISETKWFGHEVYNIDGFTLLHSGRPVPDRANGEAVVRNEGVGIVLDPQMSEAWKNAGGVWKAISSRLVLARLKLRGRPESCGRTGTPLLATIVSAYAPTHRSTQEKKDEFFADLQSTLDSVPEDDVLLLLGDFNARVGSSRRESDNPSWSSVRGFHGIGKMNESGEALLTFCAINELVIMNTTFEKKNIFKHTWQHPGSKQWHCIDYVIMRQHQRKLCCDVSVVRNAECWTDHKLLRAKVRLSVPTKVSRAKVRKRFAISGLRVESTRTVFYEAIREAVEEDWCEAESGEKKWKVIRDPMLKAAKDTLGFEKRRQPDWFKDNEASLKNLIDTRNNLFSTWLRTHHHRHRQQFLSQRRLVASEIKHAKNEWFQAKACEVEHGMMTGIAGKGVWQGLRDIQRGRRGLQPVRPRVIKKRNGDVCVSPSEAVERWRQHFETVLNVNSDYQEAALLALCQYETRGDLDEPPTEDEIDVAMMRLKMQKAGGKNGILPEMIKSCGSHIMDNICDLFHTVWMEERVPTEWRDALIVPIPKKGDLTLCDNWRGISLLDVVGKIFAKVIQNRLQEVVEEVVPDSQCGFRKE